MLQARPLIFGLGLATPLTIALALQFTLWSSGMEALFGVGVGISSLCLGYVFHQFSQIRSKELSYLQLVPQFSNFKKLRQHLSGCQDCSSEVLVQGVVGNAVGGKEALKSEKAGIEGVAKLVSTTFNKKVYNPTTDRWNDSSNTIENLRISIPFELVDGGGYTATVQPIHNAGGFRRVLERVWQEKVPAESRSLGDYATSTALKELPNGSHTREFLLVLGTSIGVYGRATLQNHSVLSSGTVTLHPIEVGSSIEGLISRNEAIVGVLKFLSVLFVVGGGGILVLSAVPLVMRALGYQLTREGEEPRRITNN